MKNKIFAARDFVKLSDLENAQAYSRMKFGCDQSARTIGMSLAVDFFEEFSEQLVSENCVVIPSPYNYVKNAATVMAGYFFDALNVLMVHSVGRSLEYSTIHRKVSYTADYGFLTKEKRAELLGQDQFYINRDFVDGKTLIFIDDVKITGTHEKKLEEIISRENLDNISHYFLYHANYLGVDADTEAKLNFYSINNDDDYLELINNDENHVIIRSIKYLMGKRSTEFKELLGCVKEKKLIAIYHGCMAEGYYRIPTYQDNFSTLRNYLDKLK